MLNRNIHVDKWVSCIYVHTQRERECGGGGGREREKRPELSAERIFLFRVSHL